MRSKTANVSCMMHAAAVSHRSHMSRVESLPLHWLRLAVNAQFTNNACTNHVPRSSHFIFYDSNIRVLLGDFVISHVGFPRC